MDELFICQACGSTGHISHLHHRFTMPGDYCKNCACFEICAACHQPEPVVTLGLGKTTRCMCWYCVRGEVLKEAC